MLQHIKKVAIAGAGGIGAYVSHFLYDYGVNRGQYPFTEWQVDVYDDDTVDVSNLLHQNYSEDDLGKNKAEIVAARYFMNAKLRFMTKEDFKDYDTIFSCVDSMKFRKELYTYGWDHPGLYWIDGRCSSRNIGVFNSKIDKKRLELHLSDEEVRRGCLLQYDKEHKVSHATPIIVAGLMLQVFLNHLREEDTNEKLLLLV